MSLRVLVTGASGFIGRRLATRLLARGDRVTALGRTACAIEGADEILLPSLDATAIVPALQGRAWDAVIHLAAAGVKPGDRDEQTLVQMNALLPAALVSAAPGFGARAVVVAGSSAEYQPAPHPLAEDAPLCADKLYGATKAAGTLLALARGAAQGIPVASLRLFNVYGPGEAPHRLLPSLASRLLRQEVVPLSPGTQLRDFVHVDDACDALVAAMDALVARHMDSGVYNVATGQPHSVADFARAAANALQADPALLQFGALPLRPDDAPCVVGDPARLAAACGWRARYDMHAGVAHALAEYSSTR